MDLSKPDTAAVKLCHVVCAFSYCHSVTLPSSALMTIVQDTDIMQNRVSQNNTLTNAIQQ